jgi:hypothetical protein
MTGNCHDFATNFLRTFENFAGSLKTKKPAKR